jgi:hypothetical protein
VKILRQALMGAVALAAAAASFMNAPQAIPTGLPDAEQIQANRRGGYRAGWRGHSMFERNRAAAKRARKARRITRIYAH